MDKEGHNIPGIIESTVTPYGGNGAKVNVPKSWLGSKVIIKQILPDFSNMKVEDLELVQKNKNTNTINNDQENNDIENLNKDKEL